MQNKSLVKMSFATIKKIFIVAALVICSACFLTGCDDHLSRLELELSVQESMEKKLNSDNIEVISVALIKKSENEYTGSAVLRNREGKTKEVSLEVLCDGVRFQWKITSLFWRVFL